MAHRTLKRVPLDFDWPLGQEWEGYVNPHKTLDCPSCDMTGYNEATRGIASKGFDEFTQDEVDALAKVERLRSNDTDTPLENPTAEKVNVLHKAGLIKIDEMVRYVLLKARAERFGVYGYCPECDGSREVFEDEETKRLHHSWKEYEPPIGEGWQLWETVSDGSPLSPAFASVEELADWSAKNDSSGLNREQWLELFREGKEAVEASSIMSLSK